MRIKQYLFFFFFLDNSHIIAISHHCSLRCDNWASRTVYPEKGTVSLSFFSFTFPTLSHLVAPGLLLLISE